MTPKQTATLVQNIKTINKVINGLDAIGYRDFLHTISGDYDRLKFTYSILSDNGFYKKVIKPEDIMSKINPQSANDYELVD